MVKVPRVYIYWDNFAHQYVIHVDDMNYEETKQSINAHILGYQIYFASLCLDISSSIHIF